MSYASVVMSARDAQCDWKERQQRVLFDAADGNWNYNNNSSALDFLNAVGGRSAAESGDPRETSFLATHFGSYSLSINHGSYTAAQCHSDQ